MKKQTLAEKAAEELIEMIREMGCQPGEKLPTEPELMQRLGVGRNTVREALRLLLSRNIVTIRQGAGTFVSEKNGVSDDPLGFEMIEDRRKLTQDLLEVRVMMEPQIAALAAQNAEEEDIKRLEDTLLRLEERMSQRKSYAELDSAFHAAVAQCSHNQVIATLIPVISDGVQVFAENVEQTEYAQTKRAHRKIFEAIAEHRAVDAQREMYYHLMFNLNRYQREPSKHTH